jgi:hypothetical protein
MHDIWSEYIIDDDVIKESQSKLPCSHSSHTCNETIVHKDISNIILKDLLMDFACLLQVPTQEPPKCDIVQNHPIPLKLLEEYVFLQFFTNPPKVLQDFFLCIWNHFLTRVLVSNCVMGLHWQSSTRGISQIWLQIKV